jgi:hypothetical protein
LFQSDFPLNTQRQSIKEVSLELKSKNAVEAADNPPSVVEIENIIELYQVQSFVLSTKISRMTFLKSI